MITHRLEDSFWAGHDRCREKSLGIADDDVQPMEKAGIGIILLHKCSQWKFRNYSVAPLLNKFQGITIKRGVNGDKKGNAMFTSREYIAHNLRAFLRTIFRAETS